MFRKFTSFFIFYVIKSYLMINILVFNFPKLPVKFFLPRLFKYKKNGCCSAKYCSL